MGSHGLTSDLCMGWVCVCLELNYTQMALMMTGSSFVLKETHLNHLLKKTTAWQSFSPIRNELFMNMAIVKTESSSVFIGFLGKHLQSHFALKIV